MWPARQPPMSGAHRRRAAVIGCAVAAVAGNGLGLAACGTSVQQYQQRYASGLRAVDASFSGSVHQLLAGLTPGAPRSQAALAVGRFELQLAGVETRLRALHAPATVSRRQRHLVRIIDRYATPLRLEVQALRSGSPVTLKRTGQRMLVATEALSTDVNATVASIEQTLGASTASSG